MEENKEKEVKKTLDKSLKRSIIIVASIIIAVILAFAIIYNSQFQSTDDAYVENHTVQVAPKVSGQIV